MPKVQSWRNRMGTILSTLERTEAVTLDRRDVERLFHLQRRAALRLMEQFGPTEHAGEWRIDKVRLLEWLQALSSREADESVRTQRVRQALQRVEDENQRLRAELRRMGRTEPAAWTVRSEVFSGSMATLPEGVTVGTGRVSVIFPPEDPTLGAKKLHQLSLAMLNDWEGFRRIAGISDQGSSEAKIGLLSAQLEELKQQGLETL